MLLLAERAMSEGKTRQAMVLLSPAAQLAPNSSLVPLISLQLGKAALATGDNRMAAEKLTAAVNHRKSLPTTKPLPSTFSHMPLQETASTDRPTAISRQLKTRDISPMPQRPISPHAVAT